MISTLRLSSTGSSDNTRKNASNTDKIMTNEKKMAPEGKKSVFRAQFNSR